MDRSIGDNEATMMAEPPCWAGNSAKQPETAQNEQKHHLLQAMLDANALFFSISYNSRQYQ
jgi:hypothetical protein